MDKAGIWLDFLAESASPFTVSYCKQSSLFNLIATVISHKKRKTQNSANFVVSQVSSQVLF